MLLGLLIVVTPTTAGAQSSCDGTFQAKLKCWAQQVKAGKSVEVTLKQPLKLDDTTLSSEWADIAQLYDSGRLAVSVPGGRETGDGGTVLLVLTTKRFIAADSKITKLRAETLKKLRDGLSCDDLCVMAKKPVSGDEVVKAGLATELSGSGSRWRTSAVAAFVLLVALLGLVVFLSRGPRTSIGHRVAPDRPSGPQVVPSPPDKPGAKPVDRRPPKRRYGRHVAIPPSPRREAIVCSDLHPQGYVEVDRCLFRAVWADHETPTPDLGESVDVVQGVGQDSDILLAIPPGTGH
jgi:hypothetical protein